MCVLGTLVKYNIGALDSSGHIIVGVREIDCETVWAERFCGSKILH